MSTLNYQRGEPLRIVRVFRESTDDGATWTRVDLSGMHYARDVRRSSSETSTLLLAIRDDDENAYATLEGETVQLDDEDAPSAVGVVVVDVPADAATTALPVGAWATDEALIDSDGVPMYLGSGILRAASRVTVP